MLSQPITLKKYIEDNFGTQTEFARIQGVQKPQVTQWINKDFIILDNTLYSARRKLKLRI